MEEIVDVPKKHEKYYLIVVKALVAALVVIVFVVFLIKFLENDKLSNHVKTENVVDENMLNSDVDEGFEVSENILQSLMMKFKKDGGNERSGVRENGVKKTTNESFFEKMKKLLGFEKDVVEVEVGEGEKVRQGLPCGGKFYKCEDYGEYIIDGERYWFAGTRGQRNAEEENIGIYGAKVLVKYLNGEEVELQLAQRGGLVSCITDHYSDIEQVKSPKVTYVTNAEDSLCVWSIWVADSGLFRCEDSECNSFDLVRLQQFEL